MIDLQKSLGDRLLEAYNEEHFIQEELKDIRTMNKQKYLEEKTIMSDERKVKIKGSCAGVSNGHRMAYSSTQFSNPTYGIYHKIRFQAQAEKAKAKPKKKSVGFAEPNEDENEEEVIHEPKEESKYLPEAKPKPILKSETIYDEALQGSSFNTPKPQRKASPKNNASSIPKISTQTEEEEDEEETSDEDEDESTESEEETETERYTKILRYHLFVIELATDSKQSILMAPQSSFWNRSRNYRSNFINVL